jgi:hypothetical protein
MMTALGSEITCRYVARGREAPLWAKSSWSWVSPLAGS